MFELNHVWTFDGTSGGLTPVEVQFPPTESALFVQNSTIATTNSFSFQTAQASSGPWFTEASTSVSTLAAAQTVLRVTGPYLWMRPYFPTKSTGAYTVRLLAVR